MPLNLSIMEDRANQQIRQQQQQHLEGCPLDGEPGIVADGLCLLVVEVFLVDVLDALAASKRAPQAPEHPARRLV